MPIRRVRGRRRSLSGLRRGRATRAGRRRLLTVVALVASGFGSSLAVAQVGKLSGPATKAKILTVCRKTSGKLGEGARRPPPACGRPTCRRRRAAARLRPHRRLPLERRALAAVASAPATAKRLLALGDRRPTYGTCSGVRLTSKEQAAVEDRLGVPRPERCLGRSCG